MVLRDIRIDTPRYVFTTPPEHMQCHTTDIVVIGSGAAGLAAALQAAEHAEVILLTRDTLPISNSAWAQGGIAAALGSADSPALHVADTIVAGAGLSDAGAVEVLTDTAPALMHNLARLGMPFERTADTFALGLEGGHSRRRVLHVGDATGQALICTLSERVRTSPRIHVSEGFQAIDLMVEAGECQGVLARDSGGAWHQFTAGATILASGGAGALYGLTSNQPAALGEGIAMAFRAGAAIADMEFVQFHPTVFPISANQGFLISEAVRGEGGRLLTPQGRRFMPDYDPRAELAPRDVVTRGIFAAMQHTGTDHVLLDLTHLAAAYLQQRFPTIYARCRAEGIDIATEPIPVAPAAHYLMGGIRTDLDGATNLDRLYAAGECACTGVHGSNRLASNSLLECLVFGQRAAVSALERLSYQPYPPMIAHQMDDHAKPHAMSYPIRATAWRAELAAIMRDYVSPIRSAGGLAEALRQLDAFPLHARAADPAGITAANAVLTARLITTSALLREESRGAHFRTDFPASDDDWCIHLVLERDHAPYTVATVAEPDVQLAA